MRVLVTGGAGFIGSHLCRRLVSNGCEVTVVDNLSTGFLQNVPAGADFVHADMAKVDSLEHLPPGPYMAVCHLAGQSSGEKSFEDPLDTLDANARSTLVLTRWALKHGVPTFLYASSMAVYGQAEVQAVSESVVPRPISYYGVSKLSAEHILQVAASQGLRRCSFRMFNVYGPGQNLDEMKQGMVSIYLAFLLRREPLIVKGSLDRIRDFVYVDDVVNAWELALRKPISGIFNLGSGRPTSVRSLITQLLLACGLDGGYPVREAQQGTLGDIHALCADITAIRNTLGWEPQVALDEGLARMVAWARSLKGVPF